MLKKIIVALCIACITSNCYAKEIVIQKTDKEKGQDLLKYIVVVNGNKNRSAKH